MLNEFVAACPEKKADDGKAFAKVLIDAVITFVNDQDDAWQNERRDCLERFNKDQDSKPDKHATHRRRFSSLGEIVACIKAIQCFADWINQIFLVISDRGQLETAPQELRDWMDTGEIVVVVHADIIPERLRPTYNSNVIETYIPRIEGLQEFYIKFDDDVLFGQPSQKSDFLASMDGKPVMKIFLSRAPYDELHKSKPDAPGLYRRTVARNFEVLKQMRRDLPEKTVPQRLVTHGPQIQSKSSTKRLLEYLESNNITLAEHPFRNKDDIMIAPLLGPHFALMNRDAVWELDDRDTFVMVRVAEWNHSVAADLEAVLANPPKFICVNNVSTMEEDRSEELLREFLAEFQKYALLISAYLCRKILKKRSRSNNEGVPAKKQLNLTDLVPSASQKTEIDIAALSPEIVKAIVSEAPPGDDATKALTSMFSFNHLQSIRQEFIKTMSSEKKDSETKYKNINRVLKNELGDAAIRTIDAPISKAALSAALKQLATDVKNIYKGNILYTQTRRLLRKILLHQFAPERTARHLAHLGTKKAPRPPKNRSRRKTLKRKIKHAHECLFRAEADNDADKVATLRKSLEVHSIQIT